MDEITIRKRLNALRIDSHVTFEFMEVRSKELGIPMSPAALSKVENGKTRLKFAHIDLYSKILEVSHEKILLGYDPESCGVITDEQAGYGQIEHRSLLESIASRDLQINQLKGQIAELQGQIEKLGVELEAMRSKNA